jgi:TonB family protein
MGKTAWLLALSMMFSGAAFAQQEASPSTSDGPLNIKPVRPLPDRDGVYRIGPGIAAPVITRAAPAVYPSGISETDVPHVCFVSAVIPSDGIPRNLLLLNPHRSIYDQLAIDAVKQSGFQAGTLDGKPVPVLIYLRVPFFHRQPAIPTVLPRYRIVAPRSRMQGAWNTPGDDDSQFRDQDDPSNLRRTDTPPVATHSVEPEYSEQARREKFGGVVVVSMIVDEEGMPTDLKLVTSIGHGLDEKALEAARQYRFTPALRDGKPVAVRITVELSFRIESILH